MSLSAVSYPFSFIYIDLYVVCTGLWYHTMVYIHSYVNKIYISKTSVKLGSGTRYTIQYSQSQDLIRDLVSNWKLDFC